MSRDECLIEVGARCGAHEADLLQLSEHLVDVDRPAPKQVRGVVHEGSFQAELLMGWGHHRHDTPSAWTKRAQYAR